MSAVLSKWMAFALVQLLWLSYNAHQPLRIDLVAFAALKVSYKHWNPSQSAVDLTVWRPTPSQLWSSTTEVGNSARGSGSLTLLGGLNTVIIPNSISIPISRGNIALVFFNSVDCFFVKFNSLSLVDGTNCPSLTNWRIHIWSLSPLVSGSTTASASLKIHLSSGGPR